MITIEKIRTLLLIGAYKQIFLNMLIKILKSEILTMDHIKF